jgi:hypothetical protein
MSSIEGKVTDIVLKRIRGLNGTSAVDEGATAAKRNLNRAKPVTVREATISDFESVCALNSRLGQGPDSMANWQRLWLENPALADQSEKRPIGWVIETSQEVVGFLGSVPLQYEFRGSGLRVAATCRFAVEPAYRAFSHLLVVSFFRQQSVDLFLNTTATVAAGKIMTALKASPLPQPDYGTVLFWVLNPSPFAEEVLKKVGIKAPFIKTGSAVASLALRGDVLLRRRNPHGASSGRYAIREESVQEIGKEFEELWSHDSSRSSILWAKRTLEIMRWHFDPPGNRRSVVVLSCRVDGRLAGYLVVRHEPANAEGIRRSLVADLLVPDGDPDVLEHLFTAACASARTAGCHVLEVIGFPERIRQVILKWKPYVRQYPAQPFFFKTRDKLLHEELLDKNAWYACPYDGDATLWP